MSALDDDTDLFVGVKLSRIQFPVSFQASSTSNGSHLHHISILQALNHINLNKLPNNSVFISEGYPQIIKIPLEIHSDLKSINSNFFYGNFKRYDTDPILKLALIHSFSNEYYQLILFPTCITVVDLLYDCKTEIQSVTSKEMLLDKCTVDESTIQSTLPSSFSMTPPEPITNQIVDSSSNDPLSFLIGRYYQTLYSLTTPLTYFPKTSLSRFRTLAANNIEIINYLEKLHLTTIQMESRHLGKFGVLNNIFTDSEPEVPLLQLELQNQAYFTSKNGSLIETIQKLNTPEPQVITEPNDSVNVRSLASVVDDKLSGLVLKLKIREAQLQIIIIFELLYSKQVVEEEFLSQNKKIAEKELKRLDRESKKSLVRNRKKPKKVVPTLLGTGTIIAEPQLNPEEKQKLDDYTIFKSLNTLVDWLGVWDTLLGNSVADENSYQFLKYILIPYYSKKLPIILRHVVSKVKDLNMKFSIPRSKSSTDSKLSSRKSESPVSTNLPVQSLPTNGRSSAKYKKVSLQSARPTLVKSATVGGLDNQDLMSSILLKRSSSNLSSKNLQRRQVDMSAVSKKDSFVKPARSKSLSENLVRPSEGLIFGNSIRSKATSFKEPAKTNLPATQVESTPAKPKLLVSHSHDNLLVINSPSIDADLCQPNNGFQIQATPIRKQQSHDVVMETPVRHQGQRAISSPGNQSFTDKLLAATNDTNLSNIIIESPFSSRSVIESSPIKLGNDLSLPNSLKRKRPGDPITEESPFFNRYGGTKESSIFQGVKKPILSNPLNLIKPTSCIDTPPSIPTIEKEEKSPIPIIETDAGSKFSATSLKDTTSEDEVDSDYEMLTAKVPLRTYMKHK